jgi:two-component system chemotaxis response regulator CheY
MSQVLVIDDSLVMRRQVGNALTAAGFSVVEASDGVDALEKLVGMPDVKLIVCDVSMPRMGGLEFLEAFAADTEKKGVPVVMLTTEAQPEMVQKARSLGAKAWLTKPLQPDLLLSLARRVVGGVR